MIYAETARKLRTGLKLAHEPVGISFHNEPPKGIPHFTMEVPSACTFWRIAEKTIFYATAEDHYNCPIGTMTMGFES